MATSYRLLRMLPTESEVPGHPEVVGRLDVNVGDGWPPVVALFIDVGPTPPELVPEFVEGVRLGIRGLFPEGRVLFVPHRGGIRNHLFRLEPEPDETVELYQRIEQLEELLEQRDADLQDAKARARANEWNASGC